MQRFIPFDEQWQELEGLDPASLVPYHFGLACAHEMAPGTAPGPIDQCTGPTSPSMVIASPT
jgi:hypothetical protein